MTSDTALVSVVIPTYYRNDRLRRSIESVRSQDYSPIEIIVVDGSGERHAEDTVDRFDDVQYLPQETNEGAHAARSFGVEHANGEYIGFLDDDDWFRPNKISLQIEFLEEHEGTGVVYCGREMEDGLRMMPDPAVQGNVLEYALMFQTTPGSPSTLLVNADVLRQIHPFGNLHGADDLGMKIELANITDFGFIDEPLVVCADTDDSLGGSMDNVEGRKQIFRDYSHMYERFPKEVKQTALAYTYMLEAEILLAHHIWSWKALEKSLHGCFYFPGINLPFIGFATATIFGRPGKNFAERLYFRFIIGDQKRGKIA